MYINVQERKDRVMNDRIVKTAYGRLPWYGIREASQWGGHSSDAMFDGEEVFIPMLRKAFDLD